MRVIAGIHRGRTLRAPKGKDTRPTTDRVRESLFSTLVSARGGLEDACVLDAFAGSGALGIEAISRGAQFACFCERGHAALQALGANTSFLEAEQYRIARIDTEKQLPPAPPTPFDLLFFDPPYAMPREAVERIVQRLCEAGLVAPDALLSYEHGVSANPTQENTYLALQWQHIHTRSFGDTALSLYRRDA